MTTHAPHKVRDGVGHVQGQGVDCIDTARLYQHVLRVFAAQVGPHYLVPLRVTGLCGHSPVVTIGSIAARTDSLVVNEVHYQRLKAVVAISKTGGVLIHGAVLHTVPVALLTTPSSQSACLVILQNVNISQLSCLCWDLRLSLSEQELVQHGQWNLP